MTGMEGSPRMFSQNNFSKESGRIVSGSAQLSINKNLILKMIRNFDIDSTGLV